MAGKVTSGSGIGHISKTITGNGILTTFTVTHNLGQTRLLVQVWDGDTNEKVIVDIDSTGVDTLDVIFASPPSNGKTYNVHIISNIKQ